jgi:hypothetical protein
MASSTVIFAVVVSALILGGAGIAKVKSERGETAPDYRLITSNDPDEGTMLSSFRHLRSKTLVIHIGNCLSCSTQAFKLSDIDGIKMPVVVYYMGSRPAWADDAVSKGVSLKSDPSSDVAADINLVWQPRWALIDRGGKLLLLLLPNPQVRIPR